VQYISDAFIVVVDNLSKAESCTNRTFATGHFTLNNLLTKIEIDISDCTNYLDLIVNEDTIGLQVHNIHTVGLVLHKLEDDISLLQKWVLDQLNIKKLDAIITINTNRISQLLDSLRSEF
jgi:hypothetical protein